MKQEPCFFSAHNICCSWDNFSLDVSFTAKKGTMTTIVGPSGSGKSTVLRIIAGLEEYAPDTEKKTHKPLQLMLDGTDITTTPPGKRNIGMVFQNHTLFPHMSVSDNVAYGLRCRGVSKKESRIQAEVLLQRFNLAGFGQRSPQTLSGGEAQRVSLARTLIVEPKLVLFDEPLSALDAPLRKRLAAEIRELQQSIGFTGIMVTHDIAEAKAVSDRILLMNKGNIIWQGTPGAFTEDMMP
jgi:ABC-type Fe3+/spermidine/putrescine transport system ATPase subunit